MFNIVELQLMRQSLDVITIVGKDAKTVANLQTKLEEVIHQESLGHNLNLVELLNRGVQIFLRFYS